MADDDLLAAVRARLDRYLEHGDADAVLDPAVRADAERLAERAGDEPEVGYELAMLYYARDRAARDSGRADGPTRDLDTAVDYFQVVHRLAPDAVPGALRPLMGRSWAPGADDLRRWHRRALDLLRDPRTRGDPDALDSAEYLLRLAADQAEASHVDHPDAIRFRMSLGVLHMTRFEQARRPHDLAEALAAFTRVVEGTAPSDPARAGRLSALGSATATRFRLTGDLDDLHRAVEQLRQAVDAPTPPGGRAHLDANLAAALVLRFRQVGDAADLDEAIMFGRRAAAELPAGQPERPRALSTLGLALRIRHERKNAADDLTEAITTLEEAVDALPPGHPDRAGVASSLSTCLRRRFRLSRDRRDLDAAVRTGRAALAEASAGHVDRPRCQANLAAALSAAYEVEPTGAGLEEAIALGTGALDVVDADDPLRATLLANLGLALRRRHERDHRPEGAAAAARAYAGSAAVVTAPPLPRATSALTAGRLWARERRWPDALDAFETAVRLLPEITDRRLERPDQEHHLAHLGGLGSAAAAAALEGGDADRALTLLEHGRGVLLAQLMQTRTDLGRLPEDHPRLAERAEHLRAELNQPVVDGPRGRERRRRLATDWFALLTEIRDVDAGFLGPPEIDDLIAAVGGETLVAVNLAEWRADALVVSADGVRRIGLPDLRYGEALAQSNALLAAVHGPAGQRDEATVTRVLEWLWDRVAEPVLRRLPELTPTAAGEPPSRLWWLPTGPLTVLPLHAAGYHGDPDRSVLDRVVSSYTPTIASLAHARRPRSVPEPMARPLVVAVPAAAGQRRLAQAEAEATRVAAVLGAAPLRGDRATRARVRDALRTSSWSHFACHATADPASPSDSYLALADGPLRVAQLSLPTGEGPYLAYLSACTTAFGGAQLPDEAIHVSSAFQLAGYGHVVGTLWPVYDTVAERTAAAFYRFLLAGGRSAAVLDPARALHAAVRVQRRKHPDRPSAWAAHVHAGG